MTHNNWRSQILLISMMYRSVCLCTRWPRLRSITSVSRWLSPVKGQRKLLMLQRRRQLSAVWWIFHLSGSGLLPSCTLNLMSHKSHSTIKTSLSLRSSSGSALWMSYMPNILTSSRNNAGGTNKMSDGSVPAITAKQRDAAISDFKVTLCLTKQNASCSKSNQSICKGLPP